MGVLWDKKRTKAEKAEADWREEREALARAKSTPRSVAKQRLRKLKGKTL